jgi:hypothetical protein
MLKFSMPNTYIYEGSQSYSLIPSASGVVINEDLPVETVIDDLESGDASQPVAVRKKSSPDGGFRTCTTAVTASVLGSTLRALPELDELVCIQKFVRLSRPGSKPSLMRIHVASDAKPFAYMLSNNAAPRLPEEPNEADWTRAFCVSSETTAPDDLLEYKLVGKAIYAGVEIAKQVRHFIENYFAVRLCSLEVDLIGSQVIQIKSFTLRNVLVRQLQVRDSESRNLKMCYVCKRSKEDLSKFVTYRMINECIENLRVRGISNELSITLKPCSEWTSFKCCDICYSLILNERELWTVSRQVFKLIPHFFPLGTVTTSVQSNHHMRLFIACERLIDSPQSACNLSRIEIRLFKNVPGIVFHLSDSEAMGGFIIAELGLLSCGRIEEWPMCEVLVFNQQDEQIASGSLSSEFVSKAFNGNSSRLVSIPVYLGQNRWSASLMLGSQLHVNTQISGNGVDVIPEKLALLAEPVTWKPLPDEWISHMRKKRSQRRRRSRSLGFN